MKITYNNVTPNNPLITLTNIPNILTINNEGAGTKAKTRLTIANLNILVKNLSYSIVVNGNRITSTWNSQQAVNKSFLLTTDNSQASRAMVTQSIVTALRSTPDIMANYDVVQEFEDGNLTNILSITARENGSKYNLTIQTTLPFIVLSSSTTTGSSEDSWVNNDTKVYVDVYRQEDEITNTPVIPPHKYITTLEKNYYKNQVSFDLSPILSTISYHDNITPYKLIIYNKTNNQVNTLLNMTTMYSSVGYMCNQGNKYIPMFDKYYLAQNITRGKDRQQLNKTILYTASPNLIFSLYNNQQTSVPITINYLTGSLKTTSTESFTHTFINKSLDTINLNLNETYFKTATYVDVVIDTIGTIRYNVIKPLNATSYSQRVTFNNSYGGKSFFDFTGARTEEHKVNNETYQTSLFNYYTNPTQEISKIYDKDVTIQVKIKSHLIDRDSIWIFNDMLNTYNAVTTINGVDYNIIIEDIKVTETDIDGIYEAELTYSYSANESFI